MITAHVDQRSHPLLDRRAEERTVTDRITVHALRAGMKGDDAVDELVRMAGGDPRRLARALRRLLDADANRRVGASACAIVLLRDALDVMSLPWRSVGTERESTSRGGASP